MCLWLAFLSIKRQNTQFIINLNKQCFNKRFSLSHPFISTSSHHPQITLEKMCTSGLRNMWGMNILTTYSMFINIRLCAGNSVWMVYTSGPELIPLLFNMSDEPSSLKYSQDCNQQTKQSHWSEAMSQTYNNTVLIPSGVKDFQNDTHAGCTPIFKIMM